jgi:predicted Zn-ribbon and HTH transcriptional regulator
MTPYQRIIRDEATRAAFVAAWKAGDPVASIGARFGIRKARTSEVAHKLGLEMRHYQRRGTVDRRIDRTLPIVAKRCVMCGDRFETRYPRHEWVCPKCRQSDVWRAA